MGTAVNKKNCDCVIAEVDINQSYAWIWYICDYHFRSHILLIGHLIKVTQPGQACINGGNKMKGFGDGEENQKLNKEKKINTFGSTKR